MAILLGIFTQCFFIVTSMKILDMIELYFLHLSADTGVQEVVDVEVEIVLADQEDIFRQRICCQGQDSR
jgi:hypothetical protein